MNLPRRCLVQAMSAPPMPKSFYTNSVSRPSTAATKPIIFLQPIACILQYLRPSGMRHLTIVSSTMKVFHATGAKHRLDS